MSLLQEHRLIPVITLSAAAQAVPLAHALMAGGIGVMEITLRTPAGLAAISAVRNSMPGMLVGAGTVTTPDLYDKAVQAGAQFMISPGLSEKLARKAASGKIPFFPGIATISEAMQALEYGFDFLKFFPAETSGGVKALKNFQPLFPDLKFCPTGGITQHTAKDYLALSNVACVGGTWLTPKEQIEAGEWDKITLIARDSLMSIA